MVCEEHPRNLSAMHNAGLQKGVEAFGQLQNDDAQAHCQAFIASPEVSAGPFLIQRGCLSGKACLSS
jgi:hypothetical protein